MQTNDVTGNQEVAYQPTVAGSLRQLSRYATGGTGVTSYAISPSGQPIVVGSTATDPGPIDLAASPDGSELYVETGGSDLVDTFAVSATGGLVATGSVASELPGHTGFEGIAVG